MVGAGVAFGLEWLLYDALVAKMAVVDTMQLFNFVPFQQLLWPMVATFGAAGFFVGVMGSWNSIRKFMDV
jgi:cell division protein FtsX